MIQKRLLWADDDAYSGLVSLVAELKREHWLELVIATNATDATTEITRADFDAFIIDVRLPPGPHKDWVSVWHEHSRESERAGLGLVLIKSLLEPIRSPVEPLQALPAVSPRRIAVLSVESPSEVQRTLGQSDVMMVQKHAFTSAADLLRILDKLLKLS